MKNGYFKYDGDCKELPYKYDPIKGVPRSYKQLAVEYESFIRKAIARHNKIERNSEDLYQGVWLRLVEADVLKKFSDGAARRLPLEMNAMDAFQFLGLKTFSEWRLFVRKGEASRTIVPLEGKRESPYAVWPTEFICECDYNGWLKTGRSPRKRSRVTAWGFKAYLRTSIHNAFANLCRTQDRRCKEDTISPQTVLSKQTDGSYRKSSTVEEFSSWEANIASAMTEEEGFVDLMALIKKANIDLGSPDGIKVLDHLVQQGSRKNGPQRNMELLSFLGQGCTLEEASRKVQVRSRVKLLA